MGLILRGGCMYEKPKVERFGTLRELTKTGVSGVGDPCFVTASGQDASGGADDRCYED